MAGVPVTHCRGCMLTMSMITRSSPSWAFDSDAPVRFAKATSFQPRHEVAACSQDRLCNQISASGPIDSSLPHRKPTLGTHPRRRPSTCDCHASLSLFLFAS